MKKKILIFSLAYYPSFVSGAEAAIKEITDRIDSREFEFHMLTLRFDTVSPLSEQIGNIHVHRVGAGGGKWAKVLFLFQAAFAARKMHSAEAFHGMWGMMTYMSIPITLAQFLGVRLPYVMTLQDGDSYDKVFKRKSIAPFIQLINRGFRQATIFQVISEHLAKWPSTRGYTGPVVKIFNGANPAALKEGSYSDEEIAALKAELGKTPTDVWLINTARLVYQKAFDTVIRSLQYLPESVKFLIVGSGEDETQLRELVQSLKLEGRVLFIGQVERDVVTKYRLASDIFVMPSRSEGLGNAGLSAMASRLPFITTGVDGLAEYSFHTDVESPYGKTAWLVPVDDERAIAAAVTDIVANPSEVSRVTQNARRMVEELFDWDQIARAMQTQIFEKIVATK